MSLARRRATPNEAVTSPSGVPLPASNSSPRVGGGSARRVAPPRPAKARHDNGEFLAADPRGEIVAARRRVEDVGELLEHHVADRMAELVVDRLEAVEIAHQQTQTRYRPSTTVSTFLVRRSADCRARSANCASPCRWLRRDRAQLLDLVDRFLSRLFDSSSILVWILRFSLISVSTTARISSGVLSCGRSALARANDSEKPALAVTCACSSLTINARSAAKRCSAALRPLSAEGVQG